MHFPLYVFAAVATLLSSLSSAQELTAIYCNASLPTGNDQPAAVYDGDDTVYIFGGHMRPEINCSNCDALKYSISQDAIQPAGEAGYLGYDGLALVNSQKEIFYLSEQNIFQYFPDTESFINRSTFPMSVFISSAIQPDLDEAWIIGGVGEDDIYSLNLTTLESKWIAKLPERIGDSGTSAIWVEEKGAAYIFNGYGADSTSPKIAKYTRSRNEFELLPSYFPVQEKYSKAVWDGRYGYIVSGFGCDDVPPSTIIQFVPETEEIRFLKVNGYPSNSTDEAFVETAAVYVEKLNRIYFFGGYLRSEMRSMHEIWYISLDPLNETSGTKSS